MPHLTLSVPKQLYEQMKRHAEIRWSEIARKAISEYLSKLAASSRSTEILEMLPPETRAKLASVREPTAKKFYAEMVKREWKRLKLLIQAS